MTLEDEVVQGRRFRKRSVGDIRSFIRRELAQPAVTQREPETAPSYTEPHLASDERLEPNVSRLTPESMSDLVQQVGNASIEEIDRLIAYLRTARAYLEGESARLRAEVNRYTEANENSHVAVELIQESIQRWRASTVEQSDDAESAEAEERRSEME